MPVRKLHPIRRRRRNQDRPSLAQLVSKIRSAPVDGSAWDRLLAVADGNMGDVDLGDQGNQTAARVYGTALAYLRTGEVVYRDKVIRVLAELPTAATPPRDSAGSQGGVLAVARQLPGYLIAAELVGYRDQDFVDFARGITTRHIGGHGRWDDIRFTSGDTANNWGTWSLASRAAIDVYLGADSDLNTVAQIFRRYTGESVAWQGYQPTDDFDPTWMCGEQSHWSGINPADCDARSGAIVEEVSRSSGSYPSVDDTGLGYSWEALAGSVITAQLLRSAGYADVYDWGDQALRRAVEFLYDHSASAGTRSTVERDFVPIAVDKMYGTAQSPVGVVAYGWCFGFTDFVTF